jgi:hypothetical protein
MVLEQHGFLHISFQIARHNFFIIFEERFDVFCIQQEYPFLSDIRLGQRV